MQGARAESTSAPTQRGNPGLGHPVFEAWVAEVAVGAVGARPAASPGPAAEDAFRELLEGRWVMTRRFEIDGVRSLLCHRPPFLARKPLSRDEFEAAVLRARGHALKVAAAVLGRSEVRVCECAGMAMRKLGIACASDLVALLGNEREDSRGALRAQPSGRIDPADVLPPAGLRATVVGADRDESIVLSYPGPRWAVPSCLTSAERSVVEQLLRGASQREIARARSTSARTVANQIGSAFRKLDVRSTLELFLLLKAPLTT